MNANPILLQMKYARLVLLFADRAGIEWEDALGFFYHSEVYRLMSGGISDMHCRSDEYLCEDLCTEYMQKVQKST